MKYSDDEQVCEVCGEVIDHILVCGSYCEDCGITCCDECCSWNSEVEAILCDDCKAIRIDEE